MFNIFDFAYLSTGPLFAIGLMVVYVANTKKRPSDKLNARISKNLKEYESDMRDRYKL